MVDSTFQNWINFIRFARRGEHHIQEVTCIGEIVARIRQWCKPTEILVTHRGHGLDFDSRRNAGIHDDEDLLTSS